MKMRTKNDYDYVQAVRRAIAETSTDDLERKLAFEYPEVLTELRKRWQRSNEIREF